MNRRAPSPRPSPPPAAGERVPDLSAVALAKAEGRERGNIWDGAPGIKMNLDAKVGAHWDHEPEPVVGRVSPSAPSVSALPGCGALGETRPAFRFEPRGWFAVFLVSTSAFLASAQIPVSFRKDIAPILAQKCLTCHGPEKSKGNFLLHTFESLMRPGASKEPPVTPGQPGKSHLFQLITAADEDERMPQKDDPLPAAQVALIERWIKEGAQFDGSDPKATLATLIPPTPNPPPPEAYPQPVPVMALAISPDGKELAAGGYHEITLWNPTDGKLLRRIKNVAQRTQSLAYSPDGKLLAMAGGTPGKWGEVKLFDTANGSPVKVLGTMPDMTLAVCFNSAGTKLAAGGADNVIRIYDVAGGQEDARIEQHADWVLGLAFSPDGAVLASASRDKSARIFDSKTGEMQNSYLGHAEAVFGVAFSGDGSLVYSAGRDKKIHAWNPIEVKPATGKKSTQKPAEIGGFDGEIYRIIVADNFIFSCSADKQVRQHNVETRELVRTFSGHLDFVYSLAYDSANKRLASGSHDGEVRVWNTQNGELLVHFTAAPGLVAAR